MRSALVRLVLKYNPTHDIDMSANLQRDCLILRPSCSLKNQSKRLDSSVRLNSDYSLKAFALVLLSLITLFYIFKYRKL